MGTRAQFVFDRVVTGNYREINDLSPGRYFWRIAPLTTKLGEFSSAAAIEVRQQAAQRNPGGRQSSLLLKDPARTESAAASPTLKPAKSSMAGRGGWRAAVGDIAYPVPAHLRAPDRLDLVGINSDGVVFALDSASGIALWSAGRRTQGANPTRVAMPLLLRSRSGVDNVVVLTGGQTFALGLSGRDGSVVWKDNEPPTFVANHAASLAPRAVIAVPYGSGALLIGGDPSRLGLRAIEFPGRNVPPNR